MMLVATITGNEANAVSKVLAGIITGFDFLGGGIIMRETSTHQLFGFTSAASLWACGLIGAGIGSGHFLLSSFTLLGMTIALYLAFYSAFRQMLSKINNLKLSYLLTTK